MSEVRDRRGWARAPRISAALLLVPLGLLGCTTAPVIKVGDFSPYLPAKVTAESGDSRYDVHV